MASLPHPPVDALTIPPQTPRHGTLTRMDSPTIRELKAELQGAQLHSAVQKFWQAATQSGTPLLEGSATTFLWRGAVQERPLLLANKFTGGYPVEQLRFNHLPGTDV